MGIVKTVKELLTGKPAKRKLNKSTGAKPAARADASLKKVGDVPKKRGGRTKLKPVVKASGKARAKRGK